LVQYGHGILKKQKLLTNLSVTFFIDKFSILLTDLSEADRLQKELKQTDLLVNATSVGMDGESLPLEKSLVLPEKLLVVDAIYKVRETPFLRWAKGQGAQTENGLGMLIGQAAESFYLWTGKKMPVAEITLEMEKEA